MDPFDPLPSERTGDLSPDLPPDLSPDLRGLEPPRLRTCDRCGERQDRSLMCVVFLRPDGGVDISLAGNLYDARVEVWCDDCQAELSPFWAMLTGDPAEDCDTIEDLYELHITSRDRIHTAWARLRDGTSAGAAGPR